VNGSAPNDERGPPNKMTVSHRINDEEIGRVMAIPILWRTTKERYSLRGEVCPECERLVFPPRRLCPYCGREQEVQEQEEQVYEYSFVLPRNMELSAVGDD
jgi:hypothetical protein